MWAPQPGEDPRYLSRTPSAQVMLLSGWSCPDPSHLLGYHSSASHALSPTSLDQSADTHAEFHEAGMGLWS